MGCRLLFVGEDANVGLACHEVNRLLRLQRRRGGCTDGPILGAWIAASGMPSIPRALRVPVSETERVRLSLRESIGVSGRWMLATFDAPAPTNFSSLAPLQVLEALLDSVGRNSSGRFAPVFAADVPPAVVEANIAGLRERRPRHFAAPLLQNPATGVLREVDRP